MDRLTSCEPPPRKELLYVFLAGMRLPCFTIRLPLLFSSPLPEDKSLRQLFLQNDLHRYTSSRRDLSFVDKHLKEAKSDNMSLVVVNRYHLSWSYLHSYSQKNVFNLPWSYSGKTNPPIPVCFATWGNWIYVLGAFADTFHSNNNHRFAIRSPQELKTCSPMHSGKGIFISVEHNNIIYVLCSTYMEFEKPEHTFEAYSCEKDSWEVLDDPPFHLWPEYYTHRGDLSYVVMGDKIHVSTENGAFSYDIGAKKWGPCYLFEGFDSQEESLECGSETCKVWESHQELPCYLFDGFDSHEESLEWGSETCQVWESHQEFSGWASETCRVCGQLECSPHMTVEVGPPFNFEGKASLYENDIVICMTPEGVVLAYRVECGRVVEKQELMYLPMQYSEHYFYFPLGVEIDYGPLVSLEDGYFCLTCKRIIEGVSKFVVLIFRVSRLANASKDCFLSSRIVSLKVIDGYEEDISCCHTSLAV